MIHLVFSMLPVGGTFNLNGREHKVLSVTPRGIRFEVEGKPKFIGPLSPRWGQFCRDAEGLVIASFHGVDAGCLVQAIVLGD